MNTQLINRTKEKVRQTAASHLNVHSDQKGRFSLEDNRPSSIVQQEQVDKIQEHVQTTKNVKDVNKPVIQCWLKQSLFQNKNQYRKKYYRTRHVYSLGIKYNQLQKRKKVSRELRINELHKLQIALLQFLDAPDMADQDVSTSLQWGKELLNNVQEEHEHLISQSVTHNDTTPPIANFKSLPKKEQTLITSLWNKLVAGSGNIQITETESRTDKTNNVHTRNHGGFKNKVLAQFARLLETSTGLEIVHHLSKDTQGNKVITIKPGLSEASNGFGISEAAASPAIMSGADKLTEFNMKDMFKNQENAKRKRVKYSRNFVKLDFGSMKNVQERTAAIYNVRKNYAWAKGVKVGNKYYRFGSGTAVNVTLTPDIPDTADHTSSRFVDGNKNEIPTPNYITLGHELGHAVHMQTGANLGDDTLTKNLFGHVAPELSQQQQKEWSNVEEYSNINHVENSIRREYGMKDRYGHINQKIVQTERLRKVENVLYEIKNVLPRNRGTFNAQLKQLITDGGAKDVVAFRTHTVALIAYLSQHLQAIFPHFTEQEILSIKVHLAKAETKTNSPEESDINEAVTALQAVRTEIQNANARVVVAQQANAPQAEQQASYFSRFTSWVGSKSPF